MEESRRGHAISGGIVAGVIGGIAISVFMLIVAITRGQEIWGVMKMAGAPFIGERAFAPGFDLGAILIGVASHLAVSIVWGVLFAALFYGQSRSTTVIAGLFWGLVVWLGMFYLVLPVAGLGEMAREAPIGMAVIQHLVFGLGVGIGFLPFQRPQPKMLPPVSSQPVVP